MRGNKCERELVAQILNEALIKEDVTKRRFAELMNIPPEKMYRYMRAEIFPTYDDYEKMYTYLGYSFEEFWNLTHAQRR